MIFEENTTKKNGKQTIINNIRKAQIIIQEKDKPDTIIPYAILTIHEDNTIIKQGNTITIVPTTQIPPEIINTLTTKNQKKTSNTKKKTKTTIKGKKAKKQEDEENDNKE